MPNRSLAYGAEHAGTVEFDVAFLAVGVGPSVRTRQVGSRFGPPWQAARVRAGPAPSDSLAPVPSSIASSPVNRRRASLACVTGLRDMSLGRGRNPTRSIGRTVATGELGARITALREARGLTQEEMAARLGLPSGATACEQGEAGEEGTWLWAPEDTGRFLRGAAGLLGASRAGEKQPIRSADRPARRSEDACLGEGLPGTWQRRALFCSEVRAARLCGNVRAVSGLRCHRHWRARYVSNVTCGAPEMPLFA